MTEAWVPDPPAACSSCGKGQPPTAPARPSKLGTGSRVRPGSEPLKGLALGGGPRLVPPWGGLGLPSRAVPPRRLQRAGVKAVRVLQGLRAWARGLCKAPGRLPSAEHHRLAWVAAPSAVGVGTGLAALVSQGHPAALEPAGPQAAEGGPGSRCCAKSFLPGPLWQACGVGEGAPPPGEPPWHTHCSPSQGAWSGLGESGRASWRSDLGVTKAQVRQNGVSMWREGSRHRARSAVTQQGQRLPGAVEGPGAGPALGHLPSTGRGEGGSRASISPQPHGEGDARPGRGFRAGWGRSRRSCLRWGLRAARICPNPVTQCHPHKSLCGPGTGCSRWLVVTPLEARAPCGL